MIAIFKMTSLKNRFTPFLKQCFVTSVVGISLVGHGAVVGYPAVLLPQINEPDSNIVSNKTIDSWIASSFAVTLLIGSFMTPGIMDHFGRKIVQYIVCALASLGWLILYLAQNVEVILLARIVGGLSFGMMLPLRSVIIGECTSPKYRGGFLTTISLTQAIGIFFIHFFGSLLSWRKSALTMFFLPLTSLIMTIFIPESPSWLISRRRFDESRQAFIWLRGQGEEQEIEDMIEAKLDFDEANRSHKINIMGHVKKAEFYKPIILLVHMFAIVEFCGSVIYAAYSTTIIKLITNANVRPKIWMVVFDIERIVVNIIAIFVINKAERRIMIATTISLCIFSFLALASYVYSKSFGLLTEDILWIPATMMFLHFLSISLGAVPLPPVLAGEVFPLQYRSIAGTISSISLCVCLFLVLKTFPALVESIEISGAYVVYACILIYCLIVVLYILPETKGRTLQDIENEYRGQLVVNRDRNASTEK